MTAVDRGLLLISHFDNESSKWNLEMDVQTGGHYSDMVISSGLTVFLVSFIMTQH